MVWTQEHRDKWIKNHPEYKKEYNKKRQKTPKEKKRFTIKNWKQRGLKLHGYTYDEVYEYYLETNNCEVCNKDLTIGGQQKSMDHCHESGCFRWILCSSCNTKDNWMTKI